MTGCDVGGTAVTLLQPTLPWENGNVEGPSLARRDGILFLLYSANNYRNSEYRIGVATCTTAAGPCQPSPEPFLASGGGIVGPGGAEWVRDGTTATGQVGLRGVEPGRGRRGARRRPGACAARDRHARPRFLRLPAGEHSPSTLARAR